MAWEHEKRYRGRAVVGEAQIEKFDNANQTLSALILVEVQSGPNQGQRLRFRGYLNNATNVERTIEEMRAMGWRGGRLGNWDGLGSKEFEFTCMSEIGADKKVYYRAAFVRPLSTVNAEKSVDAAALDALNAQFADVLAKPAAMPAGPVPTAGEEDRDIAFP